MKQVLFQVATIIFSGIIFLLVDPFEANAETEVNTEKGPVSYTHLTLPTNREV